MENEWFDSYLHKHKQRVLVNGIFSDFLMINCGVPQGSILGPFLFLIHINDIEQATKEFSTWLFADDTSLTLTDKNLDLLIERANVAFDPIYEWLQNCANELSLNLSKKKISFSNQDKSLTIIFIYHYN